ncbi:hypothetical protein [Acrocarpospora catenulata]|uniref:hypothetical protein n=1 Tax=Acrocarpospora catenulata TaxID=2836182 RepID=UPI001BDB654C|nr:hypothetical protein [Acrocarpospora catenulata]
MTVIEPVRTVFRFALAANCSAGKLVTSKGVNKRLSGYGTDRIWIRILLAGVVPSAGI